MRKDNLFCLFLLHNNTNLGRHLRRDLRFYLKQIPCKVALIEDNLSMMVVRPFTTTDTDKVEQKLFFSLSKNVPLLATSNDENNEQFIISCKSYSASIGSSENSDILKSNLVPAFKYNPQDHNISSHHELGPDSQDKSGRELINFNFRSTSLELHATLYFM